MVDVSIIIVNYRTPELIVACLKTVQQFTRQVSYEVIVVDNQSKGDDEGFVKGHFPDINWIPMGYNAGFGRANNLGMKHASGRYFLLLNSDTKLFEAVIDQCVANLDNRADAIAGGAYQVYPDLSPRAFYHTFTFRRDFWITPPPFRKYLDTLIPYTQYEDPEQVDYIAAAFLMVKREGFEKTGGFDEEFFLYGEDTEWGYRLGKIGKQLVFKNCRIIHEEWGSKPERYEDAQNFTYFNRFDEQIQLSNLVWIRKQYGAFHYFMLMLHYWLWVPVFFIMKMASNTLKLKNPFGELYNQKRFARTIGLFSGYFWKILLKRPTFYKIK